MFDNNHSICIPNKDNWQSQLTWTPDDIVCYTNGSQLQRIGRMGASVFNQTTNSMLTFPLRKHSTIFQAKIYSTMSVKLLLQYAQIAKQH